MNEVILLGRLTAEPNGGASANGRPYARYTLAVDRYRSQDGEQTADFISCVAFDKNAEFAQKYLRKGTKIAVTGRLQTGSYTNKDGQKVYTTDVVVNSQEFAESKQANDGSMPANNGLGRGYDPQTANGGFNVPPAQRGVQQTPPAQQVQSQNGGGYNNGGYAPAGNISPAPADDGGFMDIPEGFDEKLPFD